MIDIHSQQTNVPPFPELIHINLSYNQVRLLNRVYLIYVITAVYIHGKRFFLLPVVHKQQNEFLYQ